MPRVPGAVWTWLEARRWGDRETGRLAPRSAAVLATNDVSDGEPGSSSYNILLDLTFEEEGEYYLGVEQYGGAPLGAGRA